MDTEFDEEIREFLIESNENLALLDQQIVLLEQQPENQELISSVFRTIHSVKGTCGFFGFDILGSVTHITESILGQLRERKRKLTPELITLILEAVDAVKLLLQRIEATGNEGEDETEALREKLEKAYQSCGAATTIQGMLHEMKAPEPAAPAVVLEEPCMPEPAPSLPAATVVPTPAPANTTVVPATPMMSVENTPAQPKAEPAPVALGTAAVKTPVAPPASAEAQPEGQLTDTTIRVDVNLLNQLMNLVGELVLTRNQLLQSAGNFSSGVQQTSQRLNIITTELQESVMKTRMQPIGVVWSKLPRVVRDLSAKCGKQINLEMHGAETELDKSLIEAIRDPLTHIVRNSCDHGIETPQERVAKGKPATGSLSLRAFHEAGAVNIEIVDDGAGINPDRVRAKAIEKKLISPEHAAALSPSECINLIFLPGFSTAQQVTSISGRGVGMDVVKTNIEKISGSVQIVCPPEGGTCLRIKIPLTLAIIPGLIIASDHPGADAVTDGERFVIPQSHLVEMTRVDLSSPHRNVDKVNDALIFRHRGNLLPLVYLSSLLHGTEPPTGIDFINIIILQVQGKQFGVVVDRICDTQEIVVKPLGKQLKHLPCYGGATIMGDGRPALILDVGGIAKLAELDVQHKEAVSNQSTVRNNRSSAEFVLFQVNDHRMALPLTIVNRLEEISRDAIEYAAGQAVIRYRGELLPLLAASSILEEAPETAEMPGAAELKNHGSVPVIVINNGQQPFGLIVETILDIVEETLSTVRCSSHPGLLGSAVIGGTVTDIVDATALCRKYPTIWNRAPGATAYTRRVLIYSPWSLGASMMHVLLDAAGYLPTRIHSAADLKDAVLHGEIDALLLDNSGNDTLPEWLQHGWREGGSFTRTPVVEIADSAAAAVPSLKTAQTTRYLCVDRNNRAEILRTIADAVQPAQGKAA